jgi:hypothetical protein
LGFISIDWGGRSLDVALYDSIGEQRTSVTLDFSEISF